MKLLHIVPSIDPNTGGVAKGVLSLFATLEEQSITSEIVTLDDPLMPLLSDKPYFIHALGPTTGIWQYSGKLMRWLKDNGKNFDAIIVNGIWLYHGYAIWKLVKRMRNQQPKGKVAPVLIMPHGMLDSYFQKAKGRRLKAIRNLLYWKLIERRVVNDADGLLFTCEIEMLEARKTFKSYKPRSEYNIGYGITPPPVYHESMTDAFNAECKGLNGSPYLLFLSRIHPKKGVDLLINAYIELKQSQPHLPRLVIAGPGLTTRFGKEMKKRSDNSIAGSDIFFTGMLTGDAKWGAFYGADAFVLPSHQENFGVAVVEALACSKPVLISNKVNIWMEIESSGGGIVETNNRAGTLNMMKQWIELSAAEKDKMRLKAKSVYESQFTMNKVGEKLIKIVGDLITTLN